MSTTKTEITALAAKTAKGADLLETWGNACDAAGYPIHRLDTTRAQTIARMTASIIDNPAGFNHHGPALQAAMMLHGVSVDKYPISAKWFIANMPAVLKNATVK